MTIRIYYDEEEGTIFILLCNGYELTVTLEEIVNLEDIDNWYQELKSF